MPASKHSVLRMIEHNGEGISYQSVLLNDFLDACKKCRKAIVRFVMPLCPSVSPSAHKEQLGCQWMDFDKTLYLSIFLKSVKRDQVS